MRRNFRVFGTIIFLISISTGKLFAQIKSRSELAGQVNGITTAVPFLLIAPDSRTGAMGDAGVATKPDVNSIHTNPSKLAFADKKMSLGISYTPWLSQIVNDINLGYLSFYRKLDDYQTVASSLRYFSLGEINFTDENNQPTGSQNPNELALDVAYSRKLSENFSLGTALRYIRSNLASGQVVSGSEIQAGNSVAADISAYYQKEVEIKNFKGLAAWGMNISNIGTKMNYIQGNTDLEFIPTNLKTGGSIKTNLDDYNDVMLTVEFNKLLVPTPPIYAKDTATQQTYIYAGKDPRKSVAAGIFGSFSDAPGGFREELKEINYSIGAEYWYDKQFALRAGFFHEAPTKGNRQFFTVGVGLKYNIFGLDFSYLVATEARNPLQNTLRFTLKFDFDKSANSKK